MPAHPQGPVAAVDSGNACILSVDVKDLGEPEGSQPAILHSMDLVVTIATPASQAMVNLESDIPVFFISVSNPVGARIISDMEKPDKNATGTSNAIPVNEIFDLADQLTPGCKTYGNESGSRDQRPGKHRHGAGPIGRFCGCDPVKSLLQFHQHHFYDDDRIVHQKPQCHD